MGREGGEKGSEGGDIYVYIYIVIADSHYCMAETNTTMQSNFLPFKKF